MKKSKTLNILLLVIMVLSSVVMLGACGGNETDDAKDGNVTYKVTVVDAIGNPYTSGVIVKFMKGSEQFAMQVCDANGVATKELAADEYTVEVAFTAGDEGYSYDKEGLKVTADKPELEVVVAYSLPTESTELYVDSKSYEAYAIKTGCTTVKLEEGRNYYLFTPTEAGTYEVSVADGDVEAIGYYGAPHYVQSLSAAEVVDNKFTVSISASMIGEGDTGTTVLVIGVDKADSDSCVLAVERIGEPQYSVSDEPWTTYQKTSELKAYTLPEGAKLGEFDLTATSYELVYNETDGYYHLNTADGPLVLMRLATDSEYLACFKTILENSGVVKYFYDEDGNFVKKENYTDCLLEYIEYVDEKSGTYPLTEDLKYIVQQRGEYEGWWDAKGNNYLFVDGDGNKVPGINSDIAWLFMCCYIE